MYEDDVKVGEWKYYDKTGKLLAVPQGVVV